MNNIKQIGTLALLQVLQCQAVNMHAISEEYDAPETLINFNAPTVINIYNGGCGESCMDTEWTECSGDKPDHPKAHELLEHFSTKSCRDILYFRGKHFDEELKSLMAEEGIEDHCDHEYMIDRLNDAADNCNYLEDVYDELVHKQGLRVFDDILGDWFFNDLQDSDALVTEDFIVFLFGKVSEGMCDAYDHVVNSILEAKQWDWDTFVDFTFEEHSQMTAEAAVEAYKTCFAGMEEECMCYANGSENEDYCQSGYIRDPNTCDSDPRCHWGPGEIDECRAMVEDVEEEDEEEEEEEEECMCYANGSENEDYCETGQFTDPNDCDSDPRCHWGPGEIDECRAMVEDVEEEDEEEEETDCMCFANGSQNENHCETGQFTDPTACDSDPRCHWGPSEKAECRAMVNK